MHCYVSVLNSVVIIFFRILNGDDDMTIEDAIKQCKDSGLKGWDLVAYAQKLISTNMK